MSFPPRLKIFCKVYAKEMTVHFVPGFDDDKNPALIFNGCEECHDSLACRECCESSSKIANEDLFGFLENSNLFLDES